MPAYSVWRVAFAFAFAFALIIVIVIALDAPAANRMTHTEQALVVKPPVAPGAARGIVVRRPVACRELGAYSV